MNRSPQDIYTVGLDMMVAALDAKDELDAIEAARQIASDLTADELRRVSVFLAVQSMRQVRPRRSRRQVAEWILRARFTVLMADIEPNGNGPTP